jgi:hypothetical protein
MDLQLTVKTLSKSSSVTSFVGCDHKFMSAPTPNKIRYYASCSYLVAISRSSIVDDNVQTSELFFCKLDQRLPIGFLGHVCFLEFAFELSGCLLPDVFCEVCDDDFGALLFELGCDAFAKTAAAAGDDGDFAVEFALGHLICGKVG